LGIEFRCRFENDGTGEEVRMLATAATSSPVFLERRSISGTTTQQEEDEKHGNRHTEQPQERPADFAFFLFSIQ